MLAFITSLRHPDNSAIYDRVETLLRDTLRSVTNQTSDAYVVIIVGNRPPKFELPANVHFVQVNFPSPAPSDGPRTARAPFVWDKGTKIGIGLIAARDYNPDYVMIFDADDFVSRELARFTENKPRRPGWVVTTGWMYSSRRNVLVSQPDFNRTCGTSFVVPFSAYDVSADLTAKSSQREVAEHFGERLPRVLGAHRDARQWFAEHGRDLEPLPFPGAVYHVDTGENHSGKSLRGIARPLSQSVSDDYGIVSSRGTTATLWSAYGPLALWESVLDTPRKLASRYLRRNRT